MKVIVTDPQTTIRSRCPCPESCALEFPIETDAQVFLESAIVTMTDEEFDRWLDDVMKTRVNRAPKVKGPRLSVETLASTKASTEALGSRLAFPSEAR